MTGVEQDGVEQYGVEQNGVEQDGAAPGADEETHLAALLAVLALTGGDVAASGAGPHSTPLQQWRARRLAALAGEGGRPGRRCALPHHTGQRTAL
jgi:hypothetical protein